MKTNKSHDINECFYLYYKHNQGRTIKVLAEEVSLSESTVSRRIKHAKQIIVNNYSEMTLKIPLSHLNIAKPNNFMLATNSLYLTSHKIRNLTIYDPSYGEIKMYENIYYDNSVMKYKFSNTLYFILCWQIYLQE